MVTGPVLRWLLTVLFVCLAGYGLGRAVRSAPYGKGAQAARLLHAAMSLAMAAMVWPWGADAAVLPQTVFFTLAALWFLAAGLRSKTSTSTSAGLRLRCPPGSRRDHLLHAASMAAMVWMLHAMAASPRSAMSGMADMGSADTLAMGAASSTVGPLEAVGLPFFLAASLWWFFDALRHPVGDLARTGRRHSTYDLACHGAMSLGLVVMLAEMI